MERSEIIAVPNTTISKSHLVTGRPPGKSAHRHAIAVATRFNKKVISVPVRVDNGTAELARGH
jgi:hypothetical protein